MNTIDDTNSFPSNEELDSKVQKSTKWLKWKDVPLDTWYKIFLKQKIQTKHGEAVILTLVDNQQNYLTTFTTSVIKKEIENHPEYEYIRSTGIPENKKYYGFDLV